MSILEYLAYIPQDRSTALLQGDSLSSPTSGTVLFSDISGFTPITEKLQQTLGPRRGAEVLTLYLNQIYSGLIDCVHWYGGSVVTFSGDAITCWFPGDSALQATVCAFTLRQIMLLISEVILPDGELM